MLLRLARHRLVKDTAILFGVQFSGYVLPLITLPYITHILGPANFGLTALGTALILYFVVITDYGFAVTGTRQIAIVQSNPAEVSRTYSTIMLCKVCLMLFCLVSMAGIVVAVPKLRAYWLLYFLSFLQVIGQGFSPNWFLQGMQKMRYVAYSDIGAKVVSVGLIFVFVRHSSDYIFVAALQSGGFMISAAIGLLVVFTKVRVQLVRPFFKDMRDAMIAGWPVFLSQASLIAMSSTNTLILGLTSAPAQVGFLNGAQRLIIAARALMNPVANAVYPQMSRLANSSREDGLRFLRKQVLWTTIPFLAISIGIFLFSPLAVRILYPAEFGETVVLLRLMSPIPILYSIAMCYGYYYILAFGYEKEWPKIIGKMLIVNFVCIGLFLLFLPPARAVSLTTVCTELFSAASCVLFYRKTSKKA